MRLIWPTFGHFLGPIMDTVASQYFLWVAFFLEMISLSFLIIIWIGVCNFLVKGPFLGYFSSTARVLGSLESASRVVRNVTFGRSVHFFMVGANNKK